MTEELTKELESVRNELFDQSAIDERKKSYSKIKLYFPDKLIKLFYYYAMSYELGDNNKKAELYEDIMKFCYGTKFRKLGTGTNRVAFRRGMFVYKIALDRRGCIDNVSEFKRSPEAPNLFALTYETNGLIAVAEYVTLMDMEAFEQNQYAVLELLSELAKQYIFGDMGYTRKNYCNFGYRLGRSGNEAALVVLDYAYTHPRFTNEEALICPNCGGQIEYNAMFTGFRCKSCNQEYSYQDIKRRLDTSYSNLENMYMSNLSLLDMPDMEHMTFTLNEKESMFFGNTIIEKGEAVPRRKSKVLQEKQEQMEIYADESGNIVEPE